MEELRRRIGRHLSGREEKRRYVRDLFSGIAGRYDLTNDVMSLGLHRRWKDMLVELADPSPDAAVLDLATGTGDLAIRAARHMTPEGEVDESAAEAGPVVGADLTREMLEVAGERRGSERVQWMQADGLELPFPDRTFDRVLIGYGLRNLADLDRGLREIRRVLRPGGEAYSLDFAHPPARMVRRLYLKWLDVSTAAVGWLLHRDPEAYVYIPESLRRFPTQPELAERFRAAGFDRCGYVDLLFGTMAIHFARRPPVRPRRSSGR